MGSISFLPSLPEGVRRKLLDIGEETSLAPGEVLIEEGVKSHDVFLLLSGRLEVLKRAGAARHRIHEIEPGQAVGEIAFFDRRPRSATVRAIAEARVLRIPYEAVEKSPELVERLGVLLAARLRRSSEDEAEAADQRAVMGELIVKVIVLLCSYAVLLSALHTLELDVTSTTMISLPVIAVFGLGSWRFIRKTGRPLSELGLGLRSFVASLLECLLFTPLFCAMLAGLKWAASRIHEPWNALPLFEHTDWRSRLAEPYVVKLLVVYFASSAVQEMIVRSALQASLEDFLPRRRAVVLFVCALMFAINHLHMSFVFAALAFLPGLFWGWLFSRRRNLVGPVLSHFAVGAFVFFVLGISLP